MNTRLCFSRDQEVQNPAVQNEGSNADLRAAVSEHHAPKWIASLSGIGLALAMSFMSTDSTAAMGSAECQRLRNLLAHGPYFEKLMGKEKKLRGDVIEYQFLGSADPFEKCQIFEFGFGTPITLDCSMTVPMTGPNVMTREAAEGLKKLITNVAGEFAQCLEGTLPPPKQEAPGYGQSAQAERSVWAFAGAYRGPDRDKATAAWFEMLTPKTGTSLTRTSKIEFKASFMVMPKDEVSEWVQSRRK